MMLPQYRLPCIDLEGRIALLSQLVVLRTGGRHLEEYASFSPVRSKNFTGDSLDMHGSRCDPVRCLPMATGLEAKKDPANQSSLGQFLHIPYATEMSIGLAR